MNLEEIVKEVTKMIQIKEVRLQEITCREKEGELHATGNYHLISTDDALVAKQSFNDYGGTVVEFSRETKKALTMFRAQVKKDIEEQIGLRV